PHEGYAVENALNYSIGFRAPNQRDLLSNFADHIIDKEAGNSRYQDPDIMLRDSKGEIQTAEAETIKLLMQAMLNDDVLFKAWLGTTLSQPKHEMDLMPPEDLFDSEQITDLLADNDVVFERLGGTRALYQVFENEILLSVNGENYSLPVSDLAAVKLLTDHTMVTAEQLNSSKNSLVFAQTFTTLLNEGIWFC
ncbi:MAG: winged helix domain-containing protein, partial [Pseudoalteromonas prydzensis]|uniref:winged helix domain-containing protein n=1 Tax=Pseudoalteromonas prydzensis TaxID=182141 RepID=UPI003F9588DB